MDCVEPLVVQVSPIQYVKGTNFEIHLVQDVHVVDFGGRYDHDRWDISPQVQQGVKLDSCLCSSEFRPWKQRKAEIDGRGVQGISRLDQIHAKVLSGMKTLSSRYEHLSKISEDSPIPLFVGVGKSALGNLASNSSVVEFGLYCSEAGFDVSQTFSKGELGKHHGDELGEATEGAYAPISSIPLNALVELVSRKEIQDLRKNNSALEHGKSLQPQW